MFLPKSLGGTCEMVICVWSGAGGGGGGGGPVGGVGMILVNVIKGSHHLSWHH